MPEPPERTALYRLYDADGQLLYVGITKDPDKRQAQHAIDKADRWWPAVANRKVEWFSAREEAAQAEIDAIRSELPRYNRSHTARADVGLEYIDELREKVKIFPRGHSDYEALAAAVQAVIDDGEWEPGARLPRVSDIRKRFMASQGTMQRALLLLQERGIIVNLNYSGQYVACAPNDRLVSIPVGQPESAASILKARLAPEIRSALARLIAE